MPLEFRKASQLIDILEAAKKQLIKNGNDYSWSSWEDADAASVAIDEVIEEVRANKDDEPLNAVMKMFAESGPIQEVSTNSGWHDEFLKLGDRLDKIL